MKQISKFSKIFLLLISLILIDSCVSDNTEKKKNKDSNIYEVGNNKKTIFKLPSPVELFVFLHDNNAKFNKGILNTPDNSKKYFTNFSKLINFGIYASDLAYCTVFGQAQETFVYFKTTKSIGEDLGLNEGFNEIIIKRIENNQYQKDSLYQITMDAYWDACTYLEDLGENKKLSIILAGGWIESLHIAINSVDKFSPENKIVIRIAEQQLLLENLIGSFQTLKKDKHTQQMLAKLNELQTSFDKLYDNTDVIITENQFIEISNKIEKIRNQLVK
ncbi:MAG: hypothetical protein DRJ01_03520 [Bacteroidetes bacterium]|nr:MAG: hypothetical protein DRJ01_03520 [Bacteroidota bacterium]